MSKIVRDCKGCKGVIRVYKSSNRRFCSRSCYFAWRRKNQLNGESHPLWKGGRIKRTCKICGQGFTTDRWKIKNGYGHFCSTACSGKWISICAKIKRKQKMPGTKIICEACGIVFLVSPSVAVGRRFCSRKCQIAFCKGENHSAWSGGKAKRICEICKTVFETAPANVKKGHGRFCSTKCMGVWQSEHRTVEDTPGWKGGKSFEVYPPAFSQRLKKIVRGRDKHTCAICKFVWRTDEKRHHVHHIDYNKQNNGLDNLIALCVKCHRATNGNRVYWEGVLEKLMLARKDYSLAKEERWEK